MVDLASEDIRARSEHYIQLMGLAGFADRYPQELSGGMQQRVALARALINEPTVLLMDEPFGSLDSQTRVFMQEMLMRLWERTHKSVLFVTHDIDDAIFLSDRVYVMTARPGRIKAEAVIRLVRPRCHTSILEPEFLQHKRQLEELIREETKKILGKLPAFITDL